MDKHFNLNHVAMKQFIPIFFLMALLSACSEDAGLLPGADESGDALLKGAKVSAESTMLEGTSSFYCYAPKLDQVFMDGAADVKATLDIDGHKLILHTEEYFGALLFRAICFEGHISSSGQLKFQYPETWMEFNFVTSELEERSGVIAQVMDHTGCELSGPGINKGTLVYKGSFDGETLLACTQFTGKQVDDPSMPDYIGIEGPAHIKFTFNLNVVQ